MVGHLITHNFLSFFEYDDASPSHPHNAALHIEVQVHKNHVKHVLIDGGANLTIFTLKLVQSLDFSEHAIDSKKRITIKAYDDEERPLQGLIVLLI
jgi:hypothetical protein